MTPSNDITLYKLTSLDAPDCADVLVQFTTAHGLTDIPLPEPEMEGDWAAPPGRDGQRRRPPGMLFKRLAAEHKAVRLALKTNNTTSVRVYVILTHQDRCVYYGDVTELMKYVGKNGAT